MLSVILACDDPLRPELGGAQIMLGAAGPDFLPDAARPDRGAGAKICIRLPAALDIDRIRTRHADAGAVTTEPADREWGERVFQARIEGYRFMIAQEPEG
ncbi:hypothetical protein AB0I28_02155 [Phytomonospora sp. NPDC050363]|uniref:hypothetical protein n=1 Tax=Phytomonospora sp. NPDC050363 TaxID=3155642 RepID=UPI0033F0B4A4